MKNVMIAIALFLLLGTTAYGGWYVGPTYGYAYYPYAVQPAYAYPAPAPYVAYAPVVAPPMAVVAPVVVRRPMVVGPTGKVYIAGRPVRNAVRAVLP